MSDLVNGGLMQRAPAAGASNLADVGADATAGSVIFSDGSGLAEDNANFFWDNTAKKLSLGGALDVAGITTFADGTVGAPGLAPASGLSSGFYYAGGLRLAASGILSMMFGATTTESVSLAPLSSSVYNIGNAVQGWKGVYQERNDVAAQSDDNALGIQMLNKTAATAGAQKHSPMLVWEGQGHDTNRPGTMEVQFGAQVIPVQGAAAPTGELHFFSNINEAGFVSRMKLTSGGVLHLTTANPNILGLSGTLGIGIGATTVINIVSSSVTMKQHLGIADTKNITFSAGTGTKIGAATTQKFAFWNTTPVVQPAHIADPSGGGTVDAEARTAINSILAQLATTGLQAAA